MNKGDRVAYTGTLQHGPATVIEVGDGVAVIDLDGVGRVRCPSGDIAPLDGVAPQFAEGGVVSPDVTAGALGTASCVTPPPSTDATAGATGSATEAEVDHAG